MEAKKISVIIPTYNRKEKLPACVDSVLAQTYQNIEVLVVDDASTDGTEELFREISDPRVKYLRYEENHGACYARNYGAERSDGELIATNGNQFHFPVHPFHKEHAVEEFLAENRASTQTMLMKREVWETLRFDENIKRYQDWDFGIRAANTFDLGYMPEALVESEVGADSISARVASYQHLLHLYKKHLDLYEQYPKSMAVMNRRMGKRVHPTDPALAAKHFKKSLKLSKNPYDLKYWIMDSIRSSVNGRERKVSE